jgi:exodeoxyribonuclease-3
LVRGHREFRLERLIPEKLWLPVSGLNYGDFMRALRELVVRGAWRALFFLVVFVPACQGPMETVKVINWNTYHLFDHRAKLEEATTWLAEEGPDILALQEVLHCDEAGLAELALAWGHGHAVMHKENGYPVALTSSAPIKVLERRVKGFHHGFLHARTHGIDVFVVHFWPSKVGEAVIIAEMAEALMKDGHPVLVLGDFNGKIRCDEPYLLENGFGEEKDGEVVFDYRLTDAFLDRGFVELVSEHSPDDLYTFGAPALIPRWAKTMEEVRKRRRRIDFAFASSELAAGCLSAHVDTDDERVGQYSDHYPVFCTLKWPSANPSPAVRSRSR